MHNMYKIRYGHTEAYKEELVEGYDIAMLRLEELKTSTLITYVYITNVQTRIRMIWRSKDSMEFDGVL